MSYKSGGPIYTLRKQRKKLKEQLQKEIDPAQRQLLTERVDRLTRKIKKKLELSSRRKRVLSLRYPNLDR